MGSDKEQVQAPPPPTPPTATQSMEEYIKNLPKMYDVELEYQPKFAELQKSIQQQLYPTTEGLQEQLAGQAVQGMTDTPPDWYKSQSEDYMKSILGNQITGGLGINKFSTGMMEQNKQWGDYYRNLGLSMSNKLPLAQSQPLTSSFTPGSVMGMNASTYGPQMSGWNTQYNAANQQSLLNQQKPYMMMQGIGNIMQGVGSMGGGGMYGMGG